jgi:hypothetical protein
MEAIQDYIGESDNLVELHKEVAAEVTCCATPGDSLARYRVCISARRHTQLQLFASANLAKHIETCAQISACDSILAGMESMLGGFQVWCCVRLCWGFHVGSMRPMQAVMALWQSLGWLTSVCLGPCRPSGRAGLHQRRDPGPAAAVCRPVAAAQQPQGSAGRPYLFMIEPPAALLISQADMHSGSAAYCLMC